MVKRRTVTPAEAGVQKNVLDWIPAFAGMTIIICLTVSPLFSAEQGSTSEAEAVSQEARAPVMLDGQTLFSVRGTSTYPAERRAEGISRLIRSVAADRSISTDSLRIVDSQDFAALYAGDRLLVRVFDADAAYDKIARGTQALLYRQRVADAMVAYRRMRTPAALLRNTLIALASTLAAFVLFLIVSRLFRWLDLIVDRRFKMQLESLQYQSHQIIQAKPLQTALHGAVGGARFIANFTIVFIWLNVTLGLFPWTHAISLRLFPILLDPLAKMSGALLDSIPNVAFLLILALVTRYLLKFIRLYFSGLERGSIQLENFDPEWAWPTYKIVRLLVVSFAVVIAYPYIPGSGSEAFKGVSLFLGVVFSLGSSSVISNLIAGYSLTYRRAFKIGDRVRIGDVYGDVVESGLVVTRVRTPKNEDVVVPNSTILNTSVMNYSSMARKGILVLHTTVGIGYEVSWRQVESMLKLAADRTTGLLKQPPPYVLQLELGDFAVKYEINAYCNEAQKGPQLYTALHQNILDLFNEYGIQIMTPAYEGDPESAKVVPKDKWFAAPAGKNDKEKTPA